MIAGLQIGDAHAYSQNRAVAMAFSSRRLQVNDVQMHVVDEGQGAPVLLIHGFPDTHAVWRHQIPALVAAGYRVIAPDVRGHGETDAPKPVSAYRLDQQVADMVALLDALDIREPVRLVGHDLGSITGWVLAGRYPGRVHRFAALTVGHPNAYGTDPKQFLMGWYALMFQLRGVAEAVLRGGDWFVFRRFAAHPEVPHWIEQLSRPGRLSAAIAWYRANLFPMLRGQFPPVRVPVMGLYATRDIALTEAQMTASKAYVQNEWRYERIKASHWLQLDKPEEINRLLLEWFAA
jgi:pimeloyl-ACP methyl ester carboxylesterase